MIDADTAPRLHIAILATASFDFMAAGETDEQARATLRQAWDTHAAQFTASYTWNDLSDDVTVVTLRAGEALRDNSPITPPPDDARRETRSTPANPRGTTPHTPARPVPLTTARRSAMSTAPITVPASVADVEFRPVASLLDGYGHVTGIGFTNGGPEITVTFHTGHQARLIPDAETWVAYRTGDDDKDLSTDDLAAMANREDDPDAVEEMLNDLYQLVRTFVDQITAHVVDTIVPDLTHTIDDVTTSKPAAPEQKQEHGQDETGSLAPS